MLTSDVFVQSNEVIAEIMQRPVDTSEDVLIKSMVGLVDGLVCEGAIAAIQADAERLLNRP